MSISLFFDVWPRDDPTGDPLGELTQAYDKTFRAVDNAMGSGQFSINRHDSQASWCAVDNLVRVRRVAGGPFAYDDARYIGAFWIEGGTDVLVSPDEEGGEDITRGGRTAEACLRWAILYPDAFDSNNDKFATKSRNTGNWRIPNRTGGEVLAIFIRDLNDRSPDPLPFISRDFNVTTDSNGDDWSDVDTDWDIPVGTNGLDLLGSLVSGDLWYRMGADFVIHAYESDPGANLSGSITIEKAVDLAEAAEREIHARETISRALVKGTPESGKLKFREVINSTVESAVGRREGFVEFERTPTNAKLDKAGRKFIAKQKKRHDGPTSAGVLEHAGSVAFDDYQVGDTVALLIPGEFSSTPVKVFAIQLDEREGGDSDVTLEFEESPFDPGTNDGAKEFGDGTSAGKTCGDCPPIPPHVTSGDVDEYPDCDLSGVPWPYMGTAVGVSDGVDTGGPNNKPVAPNSWWCFLTGVTYHYDISASSADPGAYAWGFGISASVYGSSAAVPTQFIGVGEAPDDAAVHITGTFTITSGDFGTPHEVWFWASTADSIHAHRAVSADFRIWPDGSPTVVPADPPLEGQQHTEQFTGDGATDTFQTGYPYAPGSLVVSVGGVRTTVTETDPTTGTFQLPFIPATGSIIVVGFQNAGTTPTGGGGVVPTPGGGLIEDINTAETDTGMHLAPDGTGGVHFVADSSLTPGGAIGDRLRWDGADWVPSRLAWVPVMTSSPNLVTTDGSAVYVPLVTSGGDPVMVESLT